MANEDANPWQRLAEADASPLWAFFAENADSLVTGRAHEHSGGRVVPLCASFVIAALSVVPAPSRLMRFEPEASSESDLAVALDFFPLGSSPAGRSEVLLSSSILRCSVY